MKPGHAAALSLVGWYLMTRPLNRNLPDGVDTDAPLGKWTIIGSFDHADDCEIEAKKMTEHYEASGNKQGATRISLSPCVATDDPRLKN